MATYEEMMRQAAMQRPPTHSLPRTVYFETREEDSDDSDSESEFLTGNNAGERRRDTVVIETIDSDDEEDRNTAPVYPLPPVLYLVPTNEKVINPSPPSVDSQFSAIGSPPKSLAEVPIEEMPSHQLLTTVEDCDFDLPCVWELWGCGVSS